MFPIDKDNKVFLAILECLKWLVSNRPQLDSCSPHSYTNGKETDGIILVTMSIACPDKDKYFVFEVNPETMAVTLKSETTGKDNKKE